MSTQSAPPVAELEAAVAAARGGGRVITAEAALAAYQRDRVEGLDAGMPCAVVLAHDVAEASAALAWATAHGVTVVPRGAGSGLAGGATATEGALVVSTAEMTHRLEVDPANRIAIASAGVITATLDAAAREHGLMYPPDPSSHEICTIGGNAATNAGGLRCVKHGVTRDWVRGLEVVLADGRIIRTGGLTPKNVAGYDLTSLFVGSEGTLGIITEVTVALAPAPRDVVTIVGSFPDVVAAGDAVSAVVAAGIVPTLMELLDGNVIRAINDWKNMGLDEVGGMLLAQTDGPGSEDAAARIEEVFTAHGAIDTGRSETPEEAEELLAMRRLAYVAKERLGRCIVEDVGVPPSRLAEMIGRLDEIAERHGVRIVNVAHAGDGNLHPTFIIDRSVEGIPDEVWAAAQELFETAVAMGGTLTGEHGVGLLKQRFLAQQLGETVTELNHAIKATLDPRGLLNPGKAI